MLQSRSQVVRCVERAEHASDLVELAELEQRVVARVSSEGVVLGIRRGREVSDCHACCHCEEGL